MKLLGLAAILCAPFAAEAAPASTAADRVLRALPANPVEAGDRSMNLAARRAFERRQGLFRPADAIAKSAADRARTAAEGSTAFVGEAPRAAAIAPPPAVVGGLNFAGLADPGFSPPQPAGAIGTLNYIQLVNSRAGIYNRATGALISSGTLNQLAQVDASVFSFAPQIIWDATTSRFYYTMNSVFSASDNRLSFGFSKTDSPANVTTDWCHYTLAFGDRFPDFPRLGDSQHFAIIGVNSFDATDAFVSSDLVAVAKPPAGTDCPASITSYSKLDLRDSTGAQVFTPVPANQIDAYATGYVIARNGATPSNRLWFFNVARNAADGAALFGAARGVTVQSYDIPASATQPNFSGGAAAPLLDTLDARLTQAIQAGDPRLGSFSLWTQHTIANGATGSLIRWYEFAPVPATPRVQRWGNIGYANTFMFNGAISPDRRVDGATRAFGASFVVHYNVSSRTIAPRISASSSFYGGALTSIIVRSGVGPYRDYVCPTPADICRWGDYAGASPDPKPTAVGRGQVWGVNQFSGVQFPGVADANWRTRIFSLQP